MRFEIVPDRGGWLVRPLSAKSSGVEWVPLFARDDELGWAVRHWRREGGSEVFLERPYYWLGEEAEGV